MNLIPVRTAVIAGTCAIALSFVAVPAFASTEVSTDTAASSQVTPTDEATTTTDETDGTANPEATDDSSAADDSEVGDDSSSDVSDDNGDDASDDTADDDSSDAAPAPLPAEKGTPRQHFADATVEPKVIAKKGLHVEYTGLTAHATYQPFYSTGQSGGELGKARTANGKGVLTYTYHFNKGEHAFTQLGAEYTIGLAGVDTDLHLQQTIEVKHDSDLVWKPATRHGKKVTLSVVADHATTSGKSDTAWKKVVVDFQKKVGHKWVTVKKDRTNAKGVATVTVASGKHVWRAVVESSASVSGSTTKGHKK